MFEEANEAGYLTAELWEKWVIDQFFFYAPASDDARCT